MGTDVHSMVEIRRERYTDGTMFRGKRWLVLEEPLFYNSYYDESSDYAPFREKYRSAPLDDRNYTLFALLADVRNGRGFAGIATGDPITPLSEPRGVPEDASHGWMECVESWDVDMHSHTWFTLEELVKQNPLYDQRLVRTGIITAGQYEQIKQTGGTPEGWSGMISGPKILIVSPDEYEAGIRAESWTPEEIEEMRVQWHIGGLKRGETVEQIDFRLAQYVAEDRTHIRWVWEDSLRESTSELHTTIAALKRYADDLPPLEKVGTESYDGSIVEDKPGWHGHGGVDYADLRIVLGFDN
jgi:hypothetical protein